MFERFTDPARQVVVKAQEEAKTFSHNFIGTEHLLLGLIAVPSEARDVLIAGGMDESQVRTKIEEILGRGSMAPGGHIPFTPRAKKVLELALREALALGHNHIGPGHLLLGLMREGSGSGVQIVTGFGLSDASIKLALLEEGDMQAGAGNEPVGAGNGPGPQREKRGQALERYGRNLTVAASKGELDPVVGRQSEIKRIIQVLMRRTKNNPVLIGEPGVGKTAVVEGLAQLIADKQVPKQLRNTEIVVVDLGGMIAGARYRGDFEERIKGLLNDVKAKGNVILFFDEIHTLVGAGASEGSVDGASLLKPMLARGELRTIGATTTDEYRKHFEKDAALERRFAPVTVNEPSVDETISILRGVRDKFADHHQVTITDDALEAAARLADRYITTRQLPDKAVDLIDEAAARTVVDAYDVDREALETKLASLRQERAHSDGAQAPKLDAEITQIETRLSGFPVLSALTVDRETIASLVGEITGIPVNAVDNDESSRLLNLEAALRRRVIGQERAVSGLSRAVRRSRAGLRDPRRPAGSFIFAGPSGVGKTELAKALAAELFGDDKALIALDMSEYAEQHAVARLFGAPPGYVGYEEGGQLTEKVRRRPYSVLLLDEVEKAHPDVFNSLLQVLEEGRLTDGHGRTVDFTNIVLIMTSNLGARELSRSTGVGFSVRGDASEHALTEEKTKAALKDHFRPEFLNRIDDIVVFHRLERAHMRGIVEKIVAELAERLARTDIGLRLADTALDWLASNGYDPQMGARPLRRLITQEIEDRVSELVLGAEVVTGQDIVVSADEELGLIVTVAVRSNDQSEIVNAN